MKELQNLADQLEAKLKRSKIAAQIRAAKMINCNQQQQELQQDDLIKVATRKGATMNPWPTNDNEKPEPTKAWTMERQVSLIKTIVPTPPKSQSQNRNVAVDSQRRRRLTRSMVQKKRIGGPDCSAGQTAVIHTHYKELRIQSHPKSRDGAILPEICLNNNRS